MTLGGIGATAATDADKPRHRRLMASFADDVRLNGFTHDGGDRLLSAAGQSLQLPFDLLVDEDGGALHISYMLSYIGTCCPRL